MASRERRERRTGTRAAPAEICEMDCRFRVEVSAEYSGRFNGGICSNKAYVNGKKVCYDDCDADTWSALWFDDIIEDIGYESAGRIKVYWLLPGMQVNEDGLRLIADDKDALTMIRKVKQGHKYLMLYLDHEPERSVVQWDDVVANPVTNLPPVISPSKKSISMQNAIVEVNAEEIMVDVQSAKRERRSNRQEAADENWDSDNSSDSDYVPEIVDSDNDIQDGDDDLYQHFADQEPKEDKKAIPEADMSDDDFFEPPDSDEETDRFKNFKPFVQEDMVDPKFKTGQIFQSTDRLRKAIREHSFNGLGPYYHF
ncbi:unnamed protein product [Alopecurus aequalis]